jgi:hypothetical protein
VDENRAETSVSPCVYWIGRLTGDAKRSDSAIERRRDGFPKSLWPGLRIAAGHANVAVSEYQLHTIQRHGSVEQCGCTRVAAVGVAGWGLTARY